MTLEQYIIGESNWSVYRTADDPKLYDGKYEQFAHYLLTKEEFFTRIDEDDEDLYIDTLISLYKYYYPSENRFYWTISMSKNTPGLGNGRFDFNQVLPENVELTVDYIISLRKTFNI